MAIMEITGLERTFLVGGGLFARKKALRAVDGIDLRVDQGEVLGIVGESGCGKSTLAKMMLGLLRPTGGTVRLKGRPIESYGRRALSEIIQPVFQDPYSSLNPRRTVASIVAFPLAVKGVGSAARRRAQAIEMLERVGLPARYADVYPSQLSGGQRQRVAIARALVVRPEIVLLDEPTSALDVSVQAQILNLLIDLRHEFNLTYLFISHNLAVVEHMATRVAVMYLGRVVETGTAARLFAGPQHPYTEVLLQSALTPDPSLGIPMLDLGSSFPNPLDPPSGCAFHPRCPRAYAPCPTQAPQLLRTERGTVACHLYARPPGAPQGAAAPSHA